MRTYSPTEQAHYSRFPERCVIGTAPTLARIRASYGEKTMIGWLVVQINDYNNFVGVKEEMKSNIAQMEELARLIHARYFYLKLSEIMLFFSYLKSGNYGTVYGSVNGVDIMRAMQSFLQDRNEIITEAEAKERRKQCEENKAKGISFAEWIATRKKTQS